MKALDLKQIFHKELDVIYGKDEVASFFFLCLEQYCNVPRIQLSLEPEFSISKSETQQFFDTLDDLKKQKPIQYIFGETEFFGLKFKVTEDVLIPRQETEELVDLILQDYKTVILINLDASGEKPLKILDIGTGSGCIAISLTKHLPQAEVYALDVSHKALGIAKQNAEINNVKIHFIEANILDSGNWNLVFQDLEFDIIVSNPPYVRHLEKKEIQPNVLDNEPHLALFVEDDNPLVFYKAIREFAVNNLKEKGQLYFEINQYLGEQTKQLLVDFQFSDIELIKDLNGNHRILKGTKT